MDTQIDLKLLKKGAEASLFLTNWHGRHVIIKTRLPKPYRPVELDLRIRRYRTVHEPQLMNEAKRAGVSTPTIFMVDVENSTIIMEYIPSIQVKQIIEKLSELQRYELCIKIGESIAKLHLHGIVHGDLTTSNMLVDSSGTLFLVDFGLGDRTIELEAQGVDLHLLHQALQSTHYQFANLCFTSILKGYTNIAGSEVAEAVLAKTREIEKRGRYIAERKQDI